MERISNKDLPAGLMQAMYQLQGYVNSSGLDNKLMGLMRMRVSQINGCAYCLDMHSKEAIHAGETVQRLVSVSAWREAPYYSEKEMAVLEYAEMLTRMEEDADIGSAHNELLKHFSIQEITHIALAIAQINSWNRLMKATGTVAGNYKAGSH